MMPKDLIYARHPEGGSNYPAKVDKVGRKWLYYTDDEGKRVRIDQRNCTLQNQWFLDNMNFHDRYERDFHSLPRESRNGRKVILTNGTLVEIVKIGDDYHGTSTIVRTIGKASQEHFDDPDILIATDWFSKRETTN